MGIGDWGLGFWGWGVGVVGGAPRPRPPNQTPKNPKKKI